MKTKGFASLALRSDNCFIIITRESLPAIPYSYKEIYRIKTSGKFHFLERIYPDFDKLIEKDVMVTEDEDAGLDFYKYHFGYKVVTSHGYSNLSKYGSCDSLLIGDGCAIGAYIQDLVMTRSELWSMARTGAIRCTRSVSRRCRSIWEMTFPTRISWRRPGRHSAWCGTRRRSNKYFLPDFVLHLFYMPLLPAYGLPYIIWERADENVANQMPEEQRRIGKEWDHGSCFEHR